MRFLRGNNREEKKETIQQDAVTMPSQGSQIVPGQEAKQESKQKETKMPSNQIRPN
jgi:hypothetical protein